MTNKKKLIAKLSIGLLVFLFLCTVISRSIYVKLLPVVEVYELNGGALTSNVIVAGQYSHTNTVKIEAEDNWTVDKVTVADDGMVIKGDVLFHIDTSSQQLATKRLELEVLRLKNQLNPEPSVTAESDRIELEAQLAIAEHALSMAVRTNPDDSSIQYKQLKLEVTRLENQLDAYTRSQEDSNDLRVRLRDAKTALKDCRSQSPVDTAEETRLLTKIAELQAELDDYYITHTEERSLALQLEVAQDKLAQYTRNEVDVAAYEREQLELTVQKLKNQLSPKPVLTQQEKTTLNKQLSIATDELNAQKRTYPANGEVIAPVDGILSGVLFKEGDVLQQGQTALSILTEESKLSVTWELPFADGGLYVVGRDSIGIKMEVENAQKPEDLTMGISEKKLDRANNVWLFTAVLGEPKTPKEGSVPIITLSQSSETYDMIVPLSCLIQLEGSKFAVQTIITRQGLFSEETIVKEITVDVVEKNNLYAAVTSSDLYRPAKLVKYTSKPISDGSIVSLVKQ